MTDDYAHYLERHRRCPSFKKLSPDRSGQSPLGYLIPTSVTESNWISAGEIQKIIDDSLKLK